MKIDRNQPDNAAFSIEHLSGKNTGKIQFFELGLGEIPIQRNGSETDTVSVHAQDRSVSRDGHGKIVITQHGGAQDYKFVPRSGFYSKVNSNQIAEETFLFDSDIITVGSNDGVKIKFKILNESQYPVFDDQITYEQPISVVSLRERYKQFYKVAAVFSIVAIMSILAAVFFLDRSQHIVFQKEADELRQELARQSKSSFEQTKLKDLVASTYLIAKQSSNETIGIGTGWALSKQTLITNAHVAKSIDVLKVGQRIIAIQSGTGEVWELKKPPIFHPGYNGIKEYVQDNQFGVADIENGFKAARSIEGYDLAAFEISDERLFPSFLTVASASSLSKIPIGTNIAYAGFALDNTIFADQSYLKPNPTTQFGQITSMSDFFGLPTENRLNSYLLHHNLPAEGGTSGSPIINSAGQVVAVLSAGNIIKIGSGNGKEQRISNPVQINFAQRADLLTSIDQSDDFLRDEKKIWKKSAENFEGRLPLLEKRFFSRSKALFAKEPIDISDQYKRISPDENKLVAITEFNLIAPKNKGVGVFVRSKVNRRIRVSFKQKGEVIKVNSAFYEQQPDYVMAWINEGNNEEITILVESTGKAASEIIFSAVYFEADGS